MSTGQVSLSPIYDCAPTAYLNATYKGTGHVLNGKTAIDLVDVDDLVTEASGWGMSKRRAETTVRDCMEDVRDVVNTVELPAGAEQVEVNLESMWSRTSWPVRLPGAQA